MHYHPTLGHLIILVLIAVALYWLSQLLAHGSSGGRHAQGLSRQHKQLLLWIITLAVALVLITSLGRHPHA